MELKKQNLAVFISGQGSNLEVILQNKEKFQNLLVVSSSPKAFGLQRAENHGVESHVLDKPIDWTDLNIKLQAKGVDLIFLAGFMKIVPEDFVRAWQGRLFNLHPSMLPKFKGLKAIERAFAAQEDIGVTIHKVVPEVDSGEILLQETAISKDQLKSLSLQEAIETTHRKEHELVQKWIDQFA